MEEPKVTKLNIKDHFEEVYLRSKTIKKYLPLADVSILKNPEFGRVVNYMSGYYFKKYNRLYRAGGFDVDDIRSITQIFGLVFTGYRFQGKTERDSFMVMMCFISQRLGQMTRWIAKKFQADEVVKMQTYCTADGLIEKLGISVPPEENGLEVEVEKMSKRRIHDLRKELDKDAFKHADALSYYSVSKFVAGDVRKKARSVCKKHGINYQEWAHNYLNTHDCDESNFQIY